MFSVIDVNVGILLLNSQFVRCCFTGVKFSLSCVLWCLFLVLRVLFVFLVLFVSCCVVLSVLSSFYLHSLILVLGLYLSISLSLKCLFSFYYSSGFFYI